MRIVKPQIIGDSNLVSSTVPENDAAAYNSNTGYNLKDKVMLTNNHSVYEVLRQEISVVTISQASPALITWQNHGLTNGRMVKFSTTGTLPTGLNATTTYYVINASLTAFNVSTTQGGVGVNTTTAGTGTHTATALVNNLDPVLNPTYWLNTGSTNRWKMFDKSVQSQTTALGTFTTQIYLADLVDLVATLNLTGNSIRLTGTTPTSGTFYDNTVSLVEDEGPIRDAWDYCFTGFRVRKDFVFDNIPQYGNATYTLTINGAPTQTVGVGAALFGTSRDISSAKKGVEQGARQGITDYSVKKRDDFGNYTIVERAFSKRANWTVYVNADEVDYLHTFLEESRATPMLFIGSRKYSSSAIYGFYKNYEVTIAYPDFSVLDIEIDGLT